MAVSGGTTRGGAVLGTAAVLAVVAGGAQAALFPMGDVTAGGVWLLVGWAAFATVAGWCVEVALGRSRASSGNTSDFRTLRLDTIAVLATALLAELTLIIGRLAGDREYETAGVSGAALLVLCVGVSWHISSISSSAAGRTPSDDFLTATAFVLAEACGGWLTACFAAQGPLWVAWVVGCAFVVLAGGFWLVDSKSRDADDRHLKVFGTIAVLAVAGVVAQLAVRGETVAAWWVGGLAVGGPVLALGALILWDALTRPRTGGGRGGGRARTELLVVQLAGILVPLALLARVWWGDGPWSGPGSDNRLLNAGWFALAGAVVLVVQNVVLAWTRTRPPWNSTAGLITEVRSLAREEGRRASRTAYTGEPYLSRSSGFGRRSQLELRQAREREREQELERERQQEREEIWRRLGDSANEGGALTVFQRLTHPLLSPAAIACHRRTAVTTGLAIDEIWSRIEMVAPADTKRQVWGRERGLVALRFTIASAICTTGVWLYVVLTGLADFHVADRVAVLPALAPLLVAAVSLVQARRLLTQVCKDKANAVEVHRYELARRMHLRLPDVRSGLSMIRMAAVLSGEVPPSLFDELTQGEPPMRNTGLLEGARLQELAATVAELVRDDLRDVVHQVVRENGETPPPRSPVHTPLTERELTLLAREVGGQLKDHLTSLQRNANRDLQSVIRSSLEQSVTGPPLTNFTGYLAIELDRAVQGVTAEGGTITATVGQRVRLVVSVVRDARAQGLGSVVESRPDRDFFVLERIRVEGGRDARTVSFEAMADSSTLRLEPQRKNLAIEREQQTVFAFQLPQEEGSHEVWLQLYQAGHLVQVVALKIEATRATGATDDE